MNENTINTTPIQKYNKHKIYIFIFSYSLFMLLAMSNDYYNMFFGPFNVTQQEVRNNIEKSVFYKTNVTISSKGSVYTGIGTFQTYSGVQISNQPTKVYMMVNINGRYLVVAMTGVKNTSDYSGRLVDIKDGLAEKIVSVKGIAATGVTKEKILPMMLDTTEDGYYYYLIAFLNIILILVSSVLLIREKIKRKASDKAWKNI